MAKTLADLLREGAFATQSSGGLYRLLVGDSPLKLAELPNKRFPTYKAAATFAKTFYRNRYWGVVRDA